MATITLRPRIPTPTKKRTRNQFKAWLIHELNRRGAKLDQYSTYHELMIATERYLVRP